jgi:hypothetical protein
VAIVEIVGKTESEGRETKMKIKKEHLERNNGERKQETTVVLFTVK